MVHDHGGTIDIESVVGKGTVFTLTFPVREIRFSMISVSVFAKRRVGVRVVDVVVQSSTLFS